MPGVVEVWRRAMEEGWSLVRSGAQTELEFVEGMRVFARVTALCAELSLDVDAEDP
jgi:hypothetical protein